MITPAAIQRKEFTRGVRGYKEEEVDQFLDLVSTDLETLLRENATLKDSVKTLMQEIDSHRGSEGAILGTLEAAKALMTEISASAEKRADILLRNAELDAERIKREARESVDYMTEEAVSLSRRWELFSARFRNLLETELDRFDSFSAGLLLDESEPQKPAGGKETFAARKPPANPAGSFHPDKTIKSAKKS